MFATRFFLPFTILLSSIHAVPLFERADVTQALVDRMAYISQYAGAAYCSNNNLPQSDTKITCGPGNCPLVEAAGATSLVEFQNIGIADCTGFVALDHKNKLIVASFRGTQSIGNFLTDFNILLQPWEICTSCLVHSGFLGSWKGAKQIVKSTLDKARASYPTYTLVFTGHSLGASLATVAAADLRTEGYAIELFSYGGLMVGNAALARFITGQGKSYRITHGYDPAPKLPAGGYLYGYAHFSNEYWITSENGAPVTPNDIKVSSGEINLSGNAGTLITKPLDHAYYFGAIGACWFAQGIDFLW